MKIDLHCHSKYSGDSHLEPEDVIEQAIKLNLDGVCEERDSVDDHGGTVRLLR
jgi:histidinol phosphatase-like PHP family hydrolase